MSFTNPLLRKIGLVVFLLIVAASIFVFIAVFQQTQAILLESTTHEAISSATNAAGLVNGEALALLGPGDEGTDAYRNMQHNLNNIRTTNTDIRYIYTMRQINGTVVFIVDGDYDLSLTPLSPARIGQPYHNVTPALMSGFYGAVTEPTFTTDEWGAVFSAYAPVYTGSGETAGIVGVDIDAGLLSSRLDMLKILNLIVLLVTFILAIAVAVFTAATVEQALSALKESEEKFRFIFQTQLTGLLMVDPETFRIHDANDAALAMIGLPREQVLGRICNDIVCPAETGKCPVVNLGLTVDNSERILVRGDGSQIPILKSVKPVEIGGKKYLIESFVDLSERKKMEEQNAQLIRELESANTELKDFAYVVSHDLKAPLRAIGSLSQWLHTDYRDKFDDEGRASLDLIVNRVNRMQGLIDGILEYSRVGRVHERVETIDLDVMVREVIDSLGVPPHIAVTIDDPLPAVVYEKTRIRQVFSNLIGNAVKYMDKPTGEVHVGCRQEGAFWIFSIRDNGPGIDPRYYEKIFQIFQTLHPRDQVESTGIGLSIVKRIVEMNGGHIWVDSDVGKGSIFYFSVPISQSQGRNLP